MEWELWEPWYVWIASSLGLSPKADYEASRRLNSIIEGVAARADSLKRILAGKGVVVVGAGPSLPEALSEVLRRVNGVVVAADGACSYLLEIGVTPHIVVSDLDGDINDIRECWRRGCYVVVHAHGDNVEAVETYTPTFRERILGTTQVKPHGCLHNFGGFTDGDRAVFMSLELGCKSVLMVGMELSNVVGRYSKPWLKRNEAVWPFKKAKFIVARRLLSWASRLYWRPIMRLVVEGYDPGGEIPGVRDVGVSELEALRL
ncbi:MAG: 6-hydroxymethyl-7,8-dihydropterin pyrophosphokinase [Thermoprotei archaeon]|nr:MAG: 6-hydroxymethyl-7,8-dihydropterin pyrophosphokinase [Thermoprotei archaeon]